MSRTELDADTVFRNKKLDAIKLRHFRAEEMYERVKIRQDANDNQLWILPSFSVLGEVYKVRHIKLNRHTCDMYCEECEACIHEYKCDCPDSRENLNFCKHIHVLCLNIPSDVRNAGGVASRSVDVEESRNSTNLRRAGSSRHLQQEAKAALLGFASGLDQFTCNAVFREVIKTMESLKSKCESIVNPEQNISPVVDVEM